MQGLLHEGSRECLRERPADTQGSVRPRPVPTLDEDEDDGAILACAACRSSVTTSRARIAVGGAHEHTFANPDGLFFRIGCFGSAGCVTVGGPSRYWSWFPGYTWQVAQCAACREQLGWFFRSTGHGFHGLILDRLVELESGRNAGS